MGNRLEAQYRPEHADSPVILTCAEGVDDLIDALLAGPPGHNLAQLYSLERPLMPSGYPDHELLAGVNRNLNVGVLAFMDAESGNLVSLGPPNDRSEVFYSIAGHATGFPQRAEVPADVVRQAVKEFLASGGQRPTCVDWQVPEIW